MRSSRAKIVPYVVVGACVHLNVWCIRPRRTHPLPPSLTQFSLRDPRGIKLCHTSLRLRYAARRTVSLVTPRNSTDRKEFRLVELTQASKASRAPSSVFSGAPHSASVFSPRGAWVGTRNFLSASLRGIKLPDRKPLLVRGFLMP